MPSFIEKQHLRTVEYDHSGKSTITLYCTKDENRIELLIALPLFVVASIEIAIPALAGLEPAGIRFDTRRRHTMEIQLETFAQSLLGSD